jgi:hypothetical protein
MPLFAPSSTLLFQYLNHRSSLNSERRMTAISIIFFLLQALSHAFTMSAKDFDPPYEDNTALNQQPAPPWVDEPRKRGTLNILSGCVFTLSLCVYKAIHLNIPEPPESQWSFYRRKTKWVIISILAPELVVYCAFDQFAQETYG